MKRSAWKWIFGISLTVLILLMIFTVGLWVLFNIGGVLLRIVFILDEDMTVRSVSFAEFMANFPGSPLFYIFVTDFSALVLSAVALIATRKR